ncbi:MAG: hypothetical protein ACOY9Y_03395 [Bacillota bacterium]
MQLSPGQHSVTAVFQTKDTANRAVRALQEAGIARITVEETFSPACPDNQFSSFDAQLNQAERILQGTDPSIRGFDPALSGEHDAVFWALNAVVNSSQLNLALKIIATHGGAV